MSKDIYIADPPLNIVPPSEPVVAATRKARRDYARTEVGQMEALFREESKWKRRITIASNKLEQVRKKINDTTYALACRSGKGGSDEQKS